MNRTEEFRRYKTEVHQKRQIKLFRTYNPDEKLSDSRKGRLRKHSFCDCGTPNCPMCMNPRHNKVFGTKSQLTIQEQKCLEMFKQELKEL